MNTDLQPKHRKSESSLGLPVLSYDAGQDVTIEAAKQLNGTKLWRVRDHIWNVLAKTGEWEWEPSPSNRNKAFLERCRFDSAQQAWEYLQRRRENPVPDEPREPSLKLSA